MENIVCQCIIDDDDCEKECDIKIISFCGADENAPSRTSS